MQSDKKLLKYEKINLLHTYHIHVTYILYLGKWLKIKIKKPSEN